MLFAHDNLCGRDLDAAFEHDLGLAVLLRLYSCPTFPAGGNGTIWASSKTAFSYLRIGTASTPGHMTAA